MSCKWENRGSIDDARASQEFVSQHAYQVMCGNLSYAPDITLGIYRTLIYASVTERVLYPVSDQHKYLGFL